MIFSRIKSILALNLLLTFLPCKAIWAESLSNTGNNNSVQQLDKISQHAVVSKLAIATTQIGALRCAERADQVAKFLGSGTGDLLILDHVVGVPSTDLVTSTLLIPMGSGEYSTVDIVLAPTANGCTAHYSASFHASMNCTQAEKKFYRDLSFKSLGSVPYRLAIISANARVVARELPSGCLLTKHEVIR